MNRNLIRSALDRRVASRDDIGIVYRAGPELAESRYVIDVHTKTHDVPGFGTHASSR
jgi:hypothetical protein